MQERPTRWKPETVLQCLEMPIILAMGGLQFGFALSILDSAVWRLATVIPFAGAGLALLAGIYVAVRYVDDWA
ncbi:MAG: hypothetical protein AB7S93_01425 [Xanthobacteraceae bacterium]